MLALFLAPAATGCEKLLGIGQIDLSDERPVGCWDAAGFDGRGCYRTEPPCVIETHEQLLNACTRAVCQPFDNAARLKNLLPDGSLPPLPPDGPAAMGGAGAGGSAGAAGAAGSSAGASGTGGGALVACEDVVPAPRVYVTGSNAVKPQLAQLAPLLASLQDEATRIGIIYQPQSSCLGARAIIERIGIKGEAMYWPFADGEGHSCTLPAEGVMADVGSCDVFASTCFPLPNGLPSTVADYEGAIQAMTFVTPSASEQTVISQEAAYLVYGFGAASGVSPWVNEKTLLRRDENSGTQRMIAASIGVPSERWHGELIADTTRMSQRLTSTLEQDAESTLGIFDVINGDLHRGLLNVLAYQAAGQRCGFFPDATAGAGARDKQNVRDGHYTLWGPLHFFIGRAGDQPLNPVAKQVVEYLTGVRLLPNTGASTFIRVVSSSSTVPQCAMRVRRHSELGPLEPYLDHALCTCAFEANNGGSSNCTSCAQDADCPASSPVCRFNFCEDR